MNRRAKGDLPCSRTISRYATALGPAAKHEYFNVRDGYNQKGLEKREAVVRAAIELKIEERWHDLKQREAFGESAGASVPLTPDEMQAVIPSYKPLGQTKAEEVGEEEMSLAEQVAWAKKWAARVQNGELSPTRFPNEGALFWFQSAIGNRREFEKVVLRVESPAADGDNIYLTDGQYQMKEIERQVKEAVRESGEKLVELESGFADQFRELLKETTA